MGKSANTENVQSKIAEIVGQAASLPIVHVNRENYLQAQFEKIVTPETLAKVIELGPHAAGVPIRVITKIAQSTINHEVALATTLSFAAGIPGGWAMLATIPADLIQFHGVLLRTAQKLAYLHDWPELLRLDGENIDDETKNVLLLFLGVMYGVTSATLGLTKLAELLAANTAKKLPQQALTKTFLYPIVKKVVLAIGGKMNKTIFANSAAKFIPLAGAALSGGLTFFTFKPMASRLNRHLLKVQASKKRAFKKGKNLTAASAL